MACFLVSAAEALVVTGVEKHEEKVEKEQEEKGQDNIEPAKVPMSVRTHLNESSPRKTPSLLGIPPPFDSGTFLCNTAMAKPKIINAKNIKIMASKLFFDMSYKYLEAPSALLASHLKKNINAPVKTPQIAP